MQSSSVFERTATWQGAAPPATTEHGWIKWAAAGVAVLVTAIFCTGFVVGRSPVARLQAQHLALVGQLDHADRQITGLDRRVEAMLRHRAHCYTDDTEVADIQSMVNRAEYQAAAALAHLALTDSSKPVCPQTQAGLGALWYTASMNGLLSVPATSPTDQTPVLTWRSIEQQADTLGLLPSERVNPMTVFTMAYGAHDWQLARAAFTAAWIQQIVGPGQINQLTQYFADLRNLGLALVSQPSASAKHQGLVTLATANAIDQRYGLGQGEAKADLARLLGSGSWPQPNWSDPVLAAAKTHR